MDMFNTHYSHDLMRKYVSVFGTLFNNIEVVNRNSSDQEVERFKVPIAYGPREKFLERLETDPDLEKQLQITLPRMAFELTGLQYASSRKQNSLLRTPAANTSTALASTYVGVPYDLTFSLYIMARNTTQANQIVEQILPIFAPDFTIPALPIASLGFTKDIPVVLNSVNQSIDYEDDFQKAKIITWELTFTMMAYFWGPIEQVKIIRRVFANTFIDQSLYAGAIVRVNLTDGNNVDYKLGEIVYQGDRLDQAQAAGIVTKWDANNSYLKLGSVQGRFRTGEFIYSTNTSAKYRLNSFDMTPLKLVTIQIDPSPNNAEPDDDYGYTTTVTEWE